MRVAVVGARGQLGAAVVHELQPDHDVVGLARADLDIDDPRAVGALMARVGPGAIINCAGYNAVDAAEDHPVDALRTNAFAVRSLARAAAAADALFITCSTDFVFDGTVDQPHVEEDQPNPRSVYAASKLLGEWFAADVPRGYVLRVESLFGRAPRGPAAKGSAEGILSAIRAGSVARVFEDRTVSPTYVIDGAKAIRTLLGGTIQPGLYHCVNSGSCTWLEFALEAARQMGVAPRIERIKVVDVPLRAERPKFCALSNAKLAAAGVVMPDWRDALRRHIQAEELRSSGT